MQVLANPSTQPVDALVYPIHGILTHGERYLEHHIEQEEEDGEAPKFMCDDGIELMRKLVSVVFLAFLVASLAQNTVDEGVFGIHDGRFAILV